MNEIQEQAGMKFGLSPSEQRFAEHFGIKK